MSYSIFREKIDKGNNRNGVTDEKTEQKEFTKSYGKGLGHEIEYKYLTKKMFIGLKRNLYGFYTFKKSLFPFSS